VDHDALNGAGSWLLLIRIATFIDLNASVVPATIRNRDFDLKWISAVTCAGRVVTV
jgi:hypothetical protein